MRAPANCHSRERSYEIGGNVDSDRVYIVYTASGRRLPIKVFPKSSQASVHRHSSLESQAKPKSRSRCSSSPYSSPSWPAASLPPSPVSWPQSPRCTQLIPFRLPPATSTRPSSRARLSHRTPMLLLPSSRVNIIFNYYFTEFWIFFFNLE